MLTEAQRAERAESRRQAREQFDREYGGIDYAARAEQEAQGTRRLAAASFSTRDEPSPHDSLGIERFARAEWERNASIRLEFGDSFERYLAFTKADRKGLVRIISRKN